MTFLFADGCDSYTFQTDIFFKWPGSFSDVCDFTLTDGRFGQGALTGGAGASSNEQYLVPLPGGSWAVSGTDPLNIGFWFRSENSGLPQSIIAGGIWLINNSVGNTQYIPLLAEPATGKLQVRTNDPSSTIVATGSKVITDGVYHWIEFSIAFSTSGSGYIKVYVDGLLDIDYSGATASDSDYLPTTITAIRLLPFALCPFGDNPFMDDVYVWDGKGSDFNTFPLGPQRITTIVGTGNGDETEFTPSTPPNWQCVDGGYTEPEFISSGGATGLTDLYTYPSLIYVPVTVNGVVSNIFGQNSGDGTADITATVKTSATKTQGPTITLPLATNSLSQTIFVEDATSTPWTASTVNSSQFGLSN